MSKIYKTARGKSIDIDKVKLANETTVAVGNMRVNARGDALGAGGQIAAGRNQIMDQVYAVEDAPYSPNDSQNYTTQQALIEATDPKQFNDLANNLVVPATETDTTPAPATRGSLASSIAKPTVVVQEPVASKKPSGPSRI